MKYSPVIHIVLHEPEIPPNTGNIGRTCVAIGAKLWLVKPLGFLVNDRELKRAGMDYWQHLEWEVVEDWAHLQERLKDRRFFYLTKTAKRSYTTVDFQLEDAIVLGAESKGLPPELLATTPENNISVPMRTEVRSLNLSATAATVAYEAVRQLTLAGQAKLPIGESPIG
ncbi:tRNA (cytidine(34)-2'-O)-methyltransferase [Blastopirellula marina]|uniref:Putative tRNA (cytidine(34)-2'-O)-methyltransferase n=1 Tax=Blastopirellula marina DSM 3645 TaxID=314230 RepID=A4A2A6_9BACT|nr:tRNA (cytidine(34)-2'-O)-methyltransferase [Blastopirellula marina]EAQ77072.1 spoU rRNA Methylase family protein [Blastopirellula marina DSM 3645]